MAKQGSVAIAPTRVEDYPEWYQQVIKAADLAENSPVRGCMVIKPWGYGIWERIQRELDDLIKATGHENAYFPLFIPLSFMQKEAEHVEGFAKECAVVTHHRLEERDGILVPTGELEEPLVVRPTSETIIGEMFARWIQSYRDLPVLINQWANIVRWELRTRMFLRTTEFLWQEGHTAHATEQEAREETRKILDLYQSVAENVLAMPVITGIKTPTETFPGAVETYCIEAMMQDRKALQAGTSHYLGQNFARAANISFLNSSGEQELAYTTSWGVSTRLIGGVIMTHGDDNGLRVPPRIAPTHAVVIPVIPNQDVAAEVLQYADQLAVELRGQTYAGRPLQVHVDRRDIRGGEKSWQWIKKGVPLRLEVGPRDVAAKAVVVYRRDQEPRDRSQMSLGELTQRASEILEAIQANYLASAQQHLQNNIRTDISNFEEFKSFFTPQNQDKPEIHGGFVRAKWCCDEEVERSLADLKVTVRCLPLDQDQRPGRCVITGREATTEAIFGKSY